MSMYLRYYEDQIGGGGVKHVFTGARNQRGRGVGAWLGGLIRHILPYVTSGAKAVGKEAVRAGMHVLEDVVEGQKSLKESLRSHAKDSSRNLRRKAAEKIGDMMKGGGYKSKRRTRRAQSRKSGDSTRIVKNKKIKHPNSNKRKKKRAVSSKIKKTNKKPRTVADIFG